MINKHLIHKRSNELVGDKPKLPKITDIEYGEIAINYAVDGETLSIKNADNEIVTFSSDKKGGGVSGDYVAKSGDTMTGTLNIEATLNVGSENTASGKYSFAQGEGCTASGYYSHAEGVNTKALGRSSHAEGSGTGASGEYSHAEGSMSIADGGSSHAEGRNTRANGRSSHAEGTNTTANNYGEHASGSFNVSTLGTNQDLTALTVDSTATLFSIGNGTNSIDAKNAFEVKWNGDAHFTKSLNIGSGGTASGICSFAQGSGCTAEANCSHAEGAGTTASNHASHAEGSLTISAGNSAHAEGLQTHAKEKFSHAEGYLSYADGLQSHAEGYSASATSYSSHAEGTSTLSAGNSAHAEGANTEAKGNFSHAEGEGSKSNGTHSHTEGLNTIANNIGEHASGKYNVSNSDTLFSVGNGLSGELRSNAFELKNNGDTIISGGLTAVTISSTTITSPTIDTINTNITNISNNGYTKTEIDGKLDLKADKTNTYTKTEVDNSLLIKANSADVYTKIETDVALGLKADKTSLDGKVDKVSGKGLSTNDYTNDDKLKLESLTNYDDTAVKTLINSKLDTSVYETYTANTETILNAKVDDSTFNTYSAATKTLIDGKAPTVHNHTIAQVEGLQDELDTKVANDVYTAYTASTTTSIEGMVAKSGDTMTGDLGVETNLIVGGTFAQGSGCEAKASNSMASGRFSIAEGLSSQASGMFANTKGIASHAEGYETLASGEASHAEGKGTITNNNGEHASGLYNKSTKGVNQDLTVLTQDSEATLFSIGNGTSSVDTKNAFEVKYTGHVYVNQSLNVGVGNVSSGPSSLAVGELCISSGNNSLSQGKSCQSKGSASHAEGTNTLAGGESSHAEGLGTITKNTGEHASGRYNISTLDNTLFSVGNGTDDDKRNNAFEIKNDGSTIINGSLTATTISSTTITSPTIDDINTSIINITNNGYTKEEVDGLIPDISGLATKIALTDGLALKVDKVAGKELSTNDYTTAEKTKLASLSNYNDTTITAKIDAEILRATNAETALDTKIDTKVAKVELVQDAVDTLHYTLMVDSVNKGEINIPKDQFLKSASYDADTKELVFVFATSTGDTTTKISVADLVDEYTAGNGLTLTDNVFSIDTTITATKASVDLKANIADVYGKTETYNKTEIDSKIPVITDLVTKTELTDGLALKANSSDVYTKAQVDTSLETKQATLVSGVNIKTINGTTLLGNGDLIVVTDVNDKVSKTGDTMTGALTIESVLNVGSGNTVSGLYSFAQGEGCTASGNYSHAEGNITEAIGGYSHAEGSSTIANGNTSHAEGWATIANGNYSHAEGSNTTASGWYSHAEGEGTIASGGSSHAEGYYATTNNYGEHASGSFNVSISGDSQNITALTKDSSATLFSIGNGTSNTDRKNAFEVKWNGDAYFSGDTKFAKGITANTISSTTIDNINTNLVSKLDMGLYYSDKPTFETQINAAATYQVKGDYATNDRVNAVEAAIPNITSLATKTELTNGLATKANTSHDHTIAQVTGLQTALDGKQLTLVSGTSIKTINGNSLLGGGNVVVTADTSDKVSKSGDTMTGPLVVQSTLNVTSDIVIGGGITQGSDSRLKHDIRPLEDGTLSKVMDLIPSRFVMNNKVGVEQIGFVAQEMEEVYPEFVSTDTTTEMKSVNYAMVCSVLCKAIQELKAEIDELKAKQ